MPQQMKNGDVYMCECGARLQVLKACTCDQKQDLICTCGMVMRVAQEARG